MHPIKDNFIAMNVHGPGTHIMNLPIQKCLKSYIPKNFLECFAKLESEVKEEHFTSWSFANSKGCLSTFWADEVLLNSQLNERVFSIHPHFDLASLTKPLFLNLYLRNIFGKNFIKMISIPIVELIDRTNFNEENQKLLEFIVEHKNKFNLNSFLSHLSGVKSWFWMGSCIWQQKSTNQREHLYYKHVDLNNNNSHKIIKQNLNNSCINSFISNQYGNNLYSDINYYILARIIESMNLPKFNWFQSIEDINKSINTSLFHASLSPQKTISCIPYFPYVSNSNDITKYNNINLKTFGYTNDTNANILSSFKIQNNIVSGHSGFFGNIIDVVKSLKEIISTQKYYINSNDHCNDFQNRFIYGLDTPSSSDSTAGIKNWPKYKNKVFGHLGYTGTSFWFTTEQLNTINNFHIILTNRTSKRRNNYINKCPRIHIYTNLITNENKFFQSSNNFFSEISEQKLTDIINEYNNISKLSWDNNIIRISPNINNTRFYIANKLWNI